MGTITHQKAKGVWFTSDTHFGHYNIIKYCNRPFTSKDEMDCTIINNWNARVQPEDTIYHLGDFARANTPEEIARYLKRLNGKIKFIYGNHDKGMEKFFRSKLYLEQYQDKIECLGHYAEIMVNQQFVVLMHYALRVFNKSHYQAWALYGHSHGSLPDDPNALSFDAGVDCHNFYPLSFEDVKQIMAKKIFKPVDHHSGQRTPK